jgi:sugar phosphate isomerase/epimerase
LELEPITWTRLCTLQAAAEVIRKVSHLRLGLLVDNLHLHRSGATVAQLEKLSLPPPRLIHLCDAPQEFDPSPEALKHLAREGRLFPGEGQLDLLPVMKLAGNETVVSIEVPNREYRCAFAPLERAQRALSAARSVGEMAGIQHW